MATSKRRGPAPRAGMMPRRDGGTRGWVPGAGWDPVAAMDDATNEHYSMFFCEEEGLWSSFRGMREAVGARGLRCSLRTGRGSRYWSTPEAGGKVDKDRHARFGRAMVRDLGIDMIPACSPEARGRSERAFRARRDRLAGELALAGVAEMEAANRHPRETRPPAFNAEFARPPREERPAFVPLGAGTDLDAILCEPRGRAAGRDNRVRFGRLTPQPPPDRRRPRHFKARVGMRRHMDGTLPVWRGSRPPARRAADGQHLGEGLADAA